MQTFEDKPKLTPAEASEYLEKKHGVRRAVTTLAKMRCVSSAGPVFVRANRAILYAPARLDDYAKSIISAPMHSTSTVEAA